MKAFVYNKMLGVLKIVKSNRTSILMRLVRLAIENFLKDHFFTLRVVLEIDW